MEYGSLFFSEASRPFTFREVAFPDLKSYLWGWTANKQFSGELGSPTLRHPYIVTGFLESGDSLALRLSYHEIP